jgi:hypothetical protein
MIDPDKTDKIECIKRTKTPEEIERAELERFAFRLAQAKPPSSIQEAFDRFLAETHVRLPASEAA